MKRRFGMFFGCLVVLVFLVGPLLCGLHQLRQMREFRVVREGVLYRSGQMKLPGLKRVLHDYNIRTIINLREKTPTNKADETEEHFCAVEEINYYRFPVVHWQGEDGLAPVEENVRKFRAILDDPRNHPVLLHCHAGIHRTGAYCAIFRMEYDGWSNAKAIAELNACGYVNLFHELDVLGYLKNYRPTQARAQIAFPPRKVGVSDNPTCN